MKWSALGLVSLLVASGLALPAFSAKDSPVPAAAPRAGGEPPWPTFRGDDARTGNTSDPGPLSNRLLWSNNTGSFSYSSPAIAGGKVYIPADDGGMYCFWADNGTRVWRFGMASPAWSAPAVDVARDRVFVCDGAALYASTSRNIYCLNATTGTQIWRKSLQSYGESSPLISGDRVIVGSGDSFVGSANNNLVCFNFTNGDQLWSTPSAGSCASPALYEGRVYSAGNGLLRCLDPATGAFIWNATVSHGYGSPSAAGGRVFFAGENGRIYAFNASTGGSDWSTASGYPESYSTCAVSNGSVYACVGTSGSGGALVRLDAATGSISWTAPVATIPWVSPAVSGDQAYLAHGTTIVCINVTDRSTVWSHDAPAGTSPYGIGSSPSIAAGKLYIGGAEAKLYCFGQGEPNRPPAALKLDEPGEIRETSMVLRWNRSDAADFARYELHKSTAPGFTPGPLSLVQPGGNITDVNRLSLNVTGLDYSTRYYFRLRVWDNGFPPMFNDSNEVEGTTLTPNDAPAAVTLFPAEDVTPFSLRLSWSRNGDPDFERYEVHRGTAKGFLPVPSTLAATMTDAGQNVTTVPDLKPWTTYYFKVRVYDDGTPPLRTDSNEIEVRTGNTAPVAVTLDQPRMGATSADLGWSPSTDDDFASYEVHLSQEDGFSPNETTRATRISNRLATEHSIAGLQLARTYHFVVRVVDEGGMFNDSNFQTGLTANTLPRPVISSPRDGDVFDTRTPVGFDGSQSTDQDLDPLSFHWASSIDGFLSSSPAFTTLLSEGSHRVSLYVNDGNGHNVSERISLTVTKAPNRRPGVVVASPADNARVSGLVTLSGTASDVDGNETLRSVELKIGRDAWVEADGIGEWSHEWNTSKVQNGKYKVLFRSYDGDLYSPEASLSLTVDNIVVNRKPTVDINPLPSTRLSKTTVITGTASDPDGAVTRVEVSLNGGAWTAAFGTHLWSFSLDTTELANGRHSLQVRSFDGTENSDPVRLDFTVANEVAATTSGPGPLLLGGIALVVLVLVVAAVAVVMSRRKRGPKQKTQLLSGEEAAKQQGLIQPEEQMAAPAAEAAAPAAPAAPQRPGTGSHPAPLEATPVEDDDEKRA